MRDRNGSSSKRDQLPLSRLPSLPEPTLPSPLATRIECIKEPQATKSRQAGSLCLCQCRLWWNPYFQVKKLGGDQPDADNNQTHDSNRSGCWGTPSQEEAENQIPGTWFEKNRDRTLKSMGMVRSDSKWHGVSAYEECRLAMLFIASPCTRMGFCVLNVACLQYAIQKVGFLE